jgi:hypothetical protein
MYIYAFPICLHILHSQEPQQDALHQVLSTGRAIPIIECAKPER